MKRKIISVLLALILCFSLAVSVSAESKAVDFVVDEIGYLAGSEVDELNELAVNLYDSCGVGIFFVFTESETLEDYDIASLLNGITDYVIMLENETSWFTFYGGKGLSIDLATEETLRAAYDETETYVEGVEAFLRATAACFPYIADTPEGDILEVKEYLVFDEADLLNDSEELALEEKLADLSNKHNAQIVVCTIESMDGGDIDEFLEYLYDEMEFGYGDNHDGVLLLVCMDIREYRILSNGFAGVAIDSGDIDAIGDVIVSDLSDGNYAAAFDEFADQCDYYLDGYINGFPFNFGKNLLICLVIGIIAGVVVAFILKGQLKTVRKQDQASDYVKPGSMQVTVHNDFFLYRDVTRTKKESSSSSGSGSSRSTGGGKF